MPTCAHDGQLPTWIQRRDRGQWPQALEYLQESDRPDVILLDLMMPVMDGWEFRRRQQADPSVSGVPVIVLSALDPTRAADVNANAFLKKPLDFDRLLALVRSYCR